MYAVETEAVTKTYRYGETQIDALRGVTIQIETGRFIAIMGPSGSGKSTLLYLSGGMETPTSGRVLVEGIDLTALDDDSRTRLRRRRIGLMFQSFNLLPTLTAEENVALPLRLDGSSKPKALTRAREALAAVGLEKRLGHVPGSLSGGEQQRVAIARALVIQPAVLLADEPTGNLDSAAGRQVTRILRALVDEHHQTVVLVTHDETVAAEADVIIRLRDGQIENGICHDSACVPAVASTVDASAGVVHHKTNGAIAGESSSKHESAQSDLSS
jgi:putative ABC transport system ATP-binding protein